MFLILFFIFISLWLESVGTSLPLFLITVSVTLILYSVKQSVKQNEWVFAASFLGGLILDISAVRFAGGTSLFLTCWLFFILLYERKYEIDTIPFVLVSSFFGIFLYLWLFGYEDIFIQSISGSIISVVLFILFRRFSFSSKENLELNGYRALRV